MDRSCALARSRDGVLTNRHQRGIIEMPLPKLPSDPKPDKKELQPLMVGAPPGTDQRLWAFDEWKMLLRKKDPNAFRRPYPFAGLKQYLYSNDWTVIRNRVIKRDCGQCSACSNSANEVHHRDYRPRVLAGLDDTPLVSLCSLCHELVHCGEQRFEEAHLKAMVKAKDKNPLRQSKLPAPFKRPKNLHSDLLRASMIRTARTLKK